MIEISCFYVHYNRCPINITFIKYDKFMKIILQNRTISIRIENIIEYQFLVDFYILSLLCTKDTSKIDYEINNKGQIFYGVSTKRLWKGLYFMREYEIITLEKNFFKNPLLSQEPRRETGNKKIRKFMKEFYSYYDSNLLHDPLELLPMFISKTISDTRIEEIIKYEQMIYNLCCIKNFNNDIYASIMNYMR